MKNISKKAQSFYLIECLLISTVCVFLSSDLSISQEDRSKDSLRSNEDKVAGLLATDKQINLIKAQLSDVIFLTTDRDSRIREKAAEALGHFCQFQREVIVRLLQMLDDKDENLRQEALKALDNYLPDPSTTRVIGEKFISMIKDDNSFIGQRAGDALYKLSRFDIIDPIIREFEANPGIKQIVNRNRYTVALAMIIATNKADISQVIKALIESKNDALDEILSSALCLIGKDSVSILVNELRSGDQKASIKIVKILGCIGPLAVDSLGRLIELAQSNKIIERDQDIIAVIGAIGKIIKDIDGAGIDIIVGFLKDPRDDVRGSAALSIGGCVRGSRRALPYLRDLANDKNETVASYARRAIDLIESNAK